MEIFEKSLITLFIVGLLSLVAIVIYSEEAKNKRHEMMIEAAKSGKVQLNLDLGYKIK